MKNQTNLTRGMLARGLYHRSCGLTAIRLALRLCSQPVTHEERVRGCMKKTGMSSMGALVKAGLARYVAAEKIYVITPAGETWLTELEIHGFLNVDEGIRAPQEVAA